MTTQGGPPFVGPEFHRTQNYLLTGLRLLRGDANLPKTVKPGDELNNRMAQTVQAMGIEAAYDEVSETIEHAIAELEPLAGFFAGPTAMDVRFLSVTGALRALAETTDLLPAELMRELGRPDLAGLSDALRHMNLAAGAGYRHRAAERLRGLYVIVDPELTNGRDPAEVAQQAIAGGATALQLRDKARDKGDGLPLAQCLADLCRREGVTLIVNDHADLAAAVGADGLHVGQHDLPLAVAQSVVRPWQFVGTSNALAEEAIASYEGGASYIAVGRMFETTSKANTRPAGPETLARVRELVPAGGPPLVGIGGITADNAGEVARAGADGIAVISAVTQADDPRAAAAALLEAFASAKA